MSMAMRIVVLGSGGAVPSPERNLSGISLHYEGDVYLFDCGEGTQRQMMKFGSSYAKVKAVFISHLHLDHWLGLIGMIETLRLNGRTEKLEIFGPRGIARSELLVRDFVTVTEIGDGFEYKGDGFKVRAFDVEHDKGGMGFVFQEDAKRKFDEAKAKGMGLKGKLFREIQEKGSVETEKGKVKLEDVSWLQDGLKIVYSGDTMPCKRLVDEAKGADLIIHEATFLEEMKEEAKEKKHSTAKQAAEIAKKAGAKRLLLTHISGRYKDSKEIEKEARKVFEETIVAKDGLEVLL
ncbi:Ribonuclease Z [Candidatus Gugararchaeum adminiculabundum]|nr:Ribonuclease Z [Candidatus Gugararchaeum adminiculabundum]